MATLQITVLGGNLRQAYAAEYLSSCGYEITCFGTPDFPYNSSIHIAESLSQALEDTSVVLMPAPFPPDDVHMLSQIPSHTSVFYHGMPASFEEQLKEQDCKLYNLADVTGFCKENACLTAEGLLSEVIRYTPFSLLNTTILLIGYGKCGDAIGTLFSSLNTRIYVLEQDISKQLEAEKRGLLALSNSEKRTLLPHCDIVLNTVPNPVLTEQELKLLPGNCHIFDIASAPFGFSSDVTLEYALPYFRLPGLPGKFSPKSAGIVTGKTIERMIHHGL